MFVSYNVLFNEFNDSNDFQMKLLMSLQFKNACLKMFELSSAANKKTQIRPN